ncbi:MAG: DNA polymerase III subunit beta [Dehalococcoidia bacterium]|nr:DNA polymerase III subunit beta [Dehalococcoidia bacterium]
MNLSCMQENLAKGLGIVGRAVATRTTLPITNNVLMVTDGGRLKLSATNLEIALSYWVGAKVEEEGAITVPARLLTDFVNTLPADKVDIALNGKTLRVRCARVEAKVSGVDADDFPPIPKIAEGMDAKIDAEVLQQAISQVAFAAATEDTRPVLTGVHAEFEGSNLTLAAADGFRLAVYKASLLSPVEGKTGIIIPAKALSELSRLLSEQEESVEITVSPTKSQILFRLKNAELVSQLIQGTFPNYSQLIPQSFTSRAVINTSEFLKATRTASIFARDASGIIRLIVASGGELNMGKLTLSARAEEIGENVGDIDATVKGENAKIAFNAKYLTDVLSAIKESQVALEATTPSSPGLFRPVGSENYVHVVMPMFVQW